MRDFTWQIFKQTGNIEAYMLFREIEGPPAAESAREDGAVDDDGGDEE